MNKNYWIVIFVILIVIMGGWYLTSNRNVSLTENNGEVVSEIKEFRVEGVPFRFTPSEIRVKMGDIVKITFVNIEGTHDWRLEGYNVGTKILQAGQEEIVQFTANQRGNFEYYCSVGNHRAMGMVGTLVVE